MKKGDLIKFRKFEYHRYKIYRVKHIGERQITLIPALNYVNMGMIEVPTNIAHCKVLFDALTEAEIQEFEKKEFEHACYQSCVDIEKLIEGLKRLNKETDTHRINGEINSFLISLNQRFARINGGK